MATAARSANLFELSCEGTQITYSTSSIQGQPQLDYAGPDGDGSFSGDEIATQQTTLGTEVSVTLRRVADERTVTLTLLLPSIRLGAGGDVQFDTLAIRTTSHTTIAGPPEGATETYEPIALHGVAKAVAF